MTAHYRTTDLDRVFASSPANKTAAVVVGQEDSARELTPQQKRENLLPTIARIEAELSGGVSPARRKELGLWKKQLQDEISKLRPPKQRPTYASHFHNAARDLLQPAVYRLISEEANRRAQLDETTP